MSHGPHELRVVEDAAEGLGTFIDSTHVGFAGDISCFSFNINKLVTAGGGGFLVSNNQDHVAKAMHLANQARTENVQFHHDDCGFNYRFSALNAGIGLAQMDNISEAIERKRKIQAFYRGLHR